MSTIITHDELKAMTGCKTISALEKCLRQNGVRFLYGKENNRIYTTIDALNAAMGLKSALPKQDTEQEIDIL